jgi:hypothetical protein
MGFHQLIEDSKMVKTTEFRFASGAEAVAHFYKQGFETIEVEREHQSPDVRVMDDGINIVQIRRAEMLDWVATLIEVEGI